VAEAITREKEQANMPGARKKKFKQPAGKRDAGLDQLRRGMPAKDSVHEVVDFVSPGGVPYKILKTTEMDAYDPPPQAHKKRTKPQVS
jgi:hypothetical protein